MTVLDRVMSSGSTTSWPNVSCNILQKHPEKIKLEKVCCLKSLENDLLLKKPEENHGYVHNLLYLHVSQALFTPFFNLSSIERDKNSGLCWFKFKKYSKSPEITCLKNLLLEKECRRKLWNLSLSSSKISMQVTALVRWLCSSVACVTRA